MPGLTYGVIIPTSGNRYVPYLQNTLGAIRRQRSEVGIKVVCLYDELEDFKPLADVCCEHDADLIVTAGKHPAFCAPRARNIGTRASEADVLLHIDSDIVLHPSTFDELDALFTAEQGIAVILSVYLMTGCWPADPIFQITDPAAFDSVCRGGKFTPTGYGAVAVKRADVEHMRGHDERFYGPWADDVDFVRRLERMGRRVVRTQDECRMSMMHQHHSYPGGKIPNASNPFTARNRKILAESTDIIRNPDGWGDQD